MTDHRLQTPSMVNKSSMDLPNIAPFLRFSRLPWNFNAIDPIHVVGSTELAGFGQVSSSETTLVFHLCFRSPSDLWDTLASTRLNRVYQGIIRLNQHECQDGYLIMCSALMHTCLITFLAVLSVSHVLTAYSNLFLCVYTMNLIFTFRYASFCLNNRVIHISLIYMLDFSGSLRRSYGEIVFISQDKIQYLATNRS